MCILPYQWIEEDSVFNKRKKYYFLDTTTTNADLIVCFGIYYMH